ncbi:clostripain-related cysteine peptidase [uncultured Chloroflexus sp.]|uniref:clostripain-related cysteine peptidase n=1 Tax=uncultured Chloroflexus sp. TaxID=214040 RepID=UPI00262C9FD1|nr:clostripain-related cysteine peptidase [uncultured Chloroflexus sp.]
MVALLYQTSVQRLTVRQRLIALLLCVGFLIGLIPPQIEAVYDPPPELANLMLCTDALADPAISLGPSESPWRAIRSQVNFTTEVAQVFSPPQAIFLIEDDDGDSDGSVDVDAFGQTFTVPATAEQIIGSLRYRIPPGALGPNDTVTLSLNLPNDPTPSGRIFAVDLSLSGRADGIWRSFTWAATDIAPLAKEGAAQLVITLRGVNDGTAINISFDNIEAQVCARTVATLSGRVTQRNRTASALNDTHVLLLRYDGNRRQVVATAQVTPAEDGFRYQFSVPPLPAGAAYQVWFANQPLAPARDDRRLGVLAGPVITTLTAGQEVSNLDLELSTVRLVDPPPNATVVLADDSPVRLEIEPRGIEGETYQICLYDPALLVSETGLPSQLCSPVLTATEPFFDLVPASFATFRLRYGYPYRWYAIVRDPRGTAAHPAYGYSFAEHTITFLPAPRTLPTQPANDEGWPADAAPASWTVLIYVAADNALGDLARMSAVAQPAFELARLKALAASYPNISIVTFYDGYGNTGGEICALRGSAVDCRQQLEPNSADPATLREFVAKGLQKFPASRTMLVLVGPAHPALGFGSDETTANQPAMSIADVGSALTAATNASGKRINLVLMQAPLTANLTTALALAPAADYLVAPPGQIWRTPWLRQVLNRLAATDGNDPRAVASDVPVLYAAASRADGVLREYALAAFDLAHASAVQTARDALAAELARVLNERGTVIQQALGEVRAASTIYDSSGNGLADMMRDTIGDRYYVPEDAFLDLGDFTAALASAPALQASALAPVLTANAALTAVLGGSTPFVINARRQASGVPGVSTLPPGGGLAEFFPHHSLFGSQPLYVERLLYRGQTDAWSRFLRRYLTVDRPVGVGGVTAAPAGGTGLPLIAGFPIAYDRYLPIVIR